MDNLDINYKEVLRYLKSSEMENYEIKALILNVIEEIKKISSPKYIYSFYDIKKAEQISILNTKINIKSLNLMHHLRNSNSIAIMAATLGAEVDRNIKINEKINLTKSLIMDAVATAYIERVCDYAQESIRKEAKDRGYNITSRFSPGYGDLNIETQRDIIFLSNAFKIGITLTDSYMMIPRKSVTAIIGLCHETCEISDKCKVCKRSESCEFKA